MVMSRLLNAGFSRLHKNYVLWLGIIFMTAVSGLKVWSLFHNAKLGYEGTLSNIFFQYTEYILVIEAVLCSLYTGTEYSDHTIRNKLIVGHQREHIYGTDLIVVIAAGFLICTSYMVVSLIGIPLGLSVSVQKLLVNILCTFAMVTSIACAFTMISILSGDRTVAVTINTILSLVLWLSAYKIRNDLVMARQAGQNNLLLEFLFVFSPGCQAVQLAADPEMLYVTTPAARVLSCIVLCLITTGIGMLHFKKKDIK